MFRLYSHWVRNVPFPPRWIEALSAWLSREGAVGSDDICCSSVIISATLPGTLWVGWQWNGGQSKPTEKRRSQQPFQGFCGVQRSPSAPLRAHLTSLPHLPHLAGSKDFAAPEQHTSLLHIFHEDFLTARVRINALRSSINLQETGLIFPTSFSMAGLPFRKRDAHSSH